MKSVTLPGVKSVKSYFLSYILAVLVLSLTAGIQTAIAQQAQLSLGDIIAALRSKKVTLAERNQLLTEGVKERGITFSLLPEIEKELRTLGASSELIDAIKQKSPQTKPAPTPAPKTDPTPTPRDFIFYQNRANAQFIKGEYDSAVADYSKAIELNAKDATVYLFRAMAYYNQKNYDLAISDYTKAIELDPKESMNYFNRGNSFEKIGDLQKAFFDFQKAVELDRDNDLARSSLQRVQTELARIAQQNAAQATAQNTAPNSTPVTTPNDTPANSPSTAANNSTGTTTNTPTNTEQAVSQNTERSTESSAPLLVNLGSLMNLAVRLAMPIYPAIERQRNVEGLVTVEIMLDEKGKVLSAKATAGPKSLRAVSEDAARKTKFRPPTLNGNAVRATGFIIYNFKVNTE